MLGILVGSGLKQYGYIAAALVVTGLVGYGFTLKASNASLTAKNEALRANVMTLKQNELIKEREIAQIKEAEHVAEAWMMNFKEKADQYDTIIASIRTGNTDEILDLPLPDYIIDALNRLPDFANSANAGSE